MSKLPVIDKSVLSSIPAAKRHIHDITREMNAPFIIYAILVGFYFRFRLNYTWLFLHDKNALGKSEGVQVFVFLIGVSLSLLVLIPIFTKSLRVMKAMRVLARFNKAAERQFRLAIRALLAALIIQPIFPGLGIYFSFIPEKGQLIAIPALIGLVSSAFFAFAFIMINKALLTLREQGIYGSDIIKETVIGQYIIGGSLLFYMLIDGIFVSLGVPGYSIMSGIFLVAYIIGYIVFVAGLSKFSTNIEYIKEKFD